MIKLVTLTTALSFLTGGAALANGITADPGTECQWSPQQRVAPCYEERPAIAEPARTGTISGSENTEQGSTRFPEYNIPEGCASASGRPNAQCEWKEQAAFESLARLWPGATERTRKTCTQDRPAPAYARYTVIWSCVQAADNSAWEQRVHNGDVSAEDTRRLSPYDY